MVILALGSNLDNRLKNLDRAMYALDFIDGFMHTSIIGTKALLLPDSPPEWDKPFLNTLVCGNCDLEPLELLKRIKNIEHMLGRDLNSQKWSPRVIDIDILTFNGITYADDALTIPHKELNKRDFWQKLLLELD